MSPIRRPERAEVSVFSSQAAFIAWMEEHHAAIPELWVGYYRKATGKTSVTYPEAVDVGLMFGWIDGLTFRVDDEVHTNRFTPRRRGSTWSTANVNRMAELVAAGDARPAGIAAFEARTADNTGIYSYETAPRELPAAEAAKVRANGAAWAFWQAQTAGYRRVATHWVLSAKRPETRQRRLATLIEDCAAERWMKQYAYGRARDKRS